MVRLEKEGFIAFAYADDLVIIGFCKMRLLEAIEEVELWAMLNILTINKLKSGIIIHKFLGKACNTDKGFMRGYPYKNEYKYLGVTIDRNLTLN